MRLGAIIRAHKSAMACPTWKVTGMASAPRKTLPL